MASRADAARGIRLRPVPRSRARGGSRVNWERLGRFALLLLFVAILYSYVGPSLGLFSTWRDSQSEQSRLATEQARNERLNQRMEGLRAPGAREQQARGLGMIAPGETPYAVRGLDKGD